ncbi:hypothetical protein BJX99DRAFT_202134 [Aspergillus californicus]
MEPGRRDIENWTEIGFNNRLSIMLNLPIWRIFVGVDQDQRLGVAPPLATCQPPNILNAVPPVWPLVLQDEAHAILSRLLRSDGEIRMGDSLRPGGLASCGALAFLLYSVLRPPSPGVCTGYSIKSLLEQPCGLPVFCQSDVAKANSRIQHPDGSVAKGS